MLAQKQRGIFPLHPAVDLSISWSILFFLPFCRLSNIWRSFLLASSSIARAYSLKLPVECLRLQLHYLECVLLRSDCITSSRCASIIWLLTKRSYIFLRDCVLPIRSLCQCFFSLHFNIDDFFTILFSLLFSNWNQHICNIFFVVQIETVA